MYGTKAVIKADIAPYNSKVGINRLINRCVVGGIAMENNNRETKDYQQPISPLEYLNKRKEKKEKRKYGFTSDYSGRPGPLSLCQCLF